MKKYSLLFLSFACIFLSCRKDVLRGEGQIIIQTVPVTAFTKIKVNGSTDVHIVKGNSFSVEKKGYANLLPHLDFIVSGTTLEIGFDNEYSIKNDNTEAYVTMPSLTGININGSCDFDVNGNFTEALFNIDINGNGEVTVSDGAADELKTTVNGNGEIKAFGLTAKKAVHNVNGNGKIENTVTQELRAIVNGNGTIYYKGNPTTVTSEITGSGKVIKL